MFKKKRQKKKGKKLAPEAMTPKLQPLTIVYTIFALSPGLNLGDGKELANRPSLPGGSTPRECCPIAPSRGQDGYCMFLKVIFFLKTGGKMG